MNHSPLLLACLFLASNLAGAQVTRLNPPFPRDQVVGDVRDFRVHPWTGDVLFRVDARQQGALELYRAPVGGGARSLPVVSIQGGREVTDYAFSRDGQWLVYRADASTDEVFDLYSYRLGTPGTTRLSVEGSSGDVSAFEFGGNGARTFYLRGGSLFAVPTAGGTPVRLNAALPAGRSVQGFVLNATGTRVVYWGNQDSPTRVELYSVPATGGSPVKLSGTLAAGTNVAGPVWVPTGSGQALYRVRSSFYYELFRVPLDGSTAPVSIQSELPEPRFAIPAFEPSADGRRVVYLKWLSGSLERLYSAPLDGSAAPVELSPPLSADQYVVQFNLAPDSSRVAFIVATTNTYLQSSLYVAPLAGGPATLLDGLPSRIHTVELGSDSARAFYVEGDGEFRSVRLDGTTPPVRLNDAASALGLFADRRNPFALAPDASRALFFSTTGALHQVPSDGSAPPVLLHAGDLRPGFGFDTSGTLALFTAQVDPEGPDVLLSAPIDGSAPAVRLSTQLARGSSDDVRLRLYDGGEQAFVHAGAGQVALTVNSARVWLAREDGSTPPLLLDPAQRALQTLQATADGATIAFTENLAPPSRLWALPSNGSAPAKLLATDLARFDAFALTADGTRAVYRSAAGLRSTPLAAANRITLMSGDVQGFVLTRDGTRAVYVGHPTLAEYVVGVVPIDGSAPALELARTPNYPALLPVADGSRLVFTRGSELCSVPLDGSAPVTVLAPSIAIGGLPFLTLDAAGENALYIARSGNPWFLWRAAVDGSSPPAILAPADASASPARVTADGTVLLVTASRLFAVAVDGSSPPIDLAGGVTIRHGNNGGQGAEVFLTPDESRVLYVSDVASDQLWSVPRDGSAPPVFLSYTFAGSGMVRTDRGSPFLRVSPSSSHVLFRASTTQFGRADLFLVPVDGGRVLRLDPPVAGLGVTYFDFSSDGRRALYQAEETAGVTELFSVELPEIPQQRHTTPR